MFTVALSLSVIAEFYSIVGLTAIFAGAPISITVMGVILGTSKLSTIVWLHEFWKQVKWVMKIYLVSAVMVLMFLTSMGIFGYLSKAHIEQVGAGQENAAQIQRLTVELQRQNDIVKLAESKSKTLETNGTGADANVQSQINQEQQRIDSAYSRIQPAIDDQQRIVDAQTKIYQDQIIKIDQQLAQLQQYQDAKEVDRVQSLVGIKADGDWGPGTARAVTTWKNTRTDERNAAVLKLEEANTNPTIKSARDEILRIRKGVETQISESNKLIDRLRNQLGKGDSASVETLINEQQEKIKTANLEIEKLTQQKYTLEIEYRKFEVEVGPIKYIADLIYGDNSDKNMLEHAVRWVIILIVAVFDPLAAMMLLAATESMRWIRQRLPKQKDPIDESEKSRLSDLLKKTQSERDKLFKAHSYEMERADTLAVKLEEVESNTRKSLDELLSETPEVMMFETQDSNTAKDSEVETLSTVIDEPIILIPSEIKTEDVTSAKVIYQEMNGYVTCMINYRKLHISRYLQVYQALLHMLDL